MTSRWFVFAFAVALGAGLTPSCSSSTSAGYMLCSEAGTCPVGYECQADVCVQTGAGGAAGSGAGGTGGSAAASGGVGASGGAGGSSSCTAGVDCSGCTACYDSCICTGAPSDQCLTACTGSGGVGGGTGGVGGGTGGVGATGATGGFGGTGGTGGFSGTGGGTGGTGGFGATGGTGGTGGFSGTGGTGGSAGFTCDQIFQPSVCATCIVNECCSQAEGCFSGTCGSLWECLNTYCAAAADVQQCAQDNCSAYLDGVVEYNALVECMGLYCVTDCGGDGG